MSDLEIKFAPGGDGEIVGYASLFGGPADAVNDIVSPAAFKTSLAAALPEMLREHKGQPVGEWLDAEEDDIGLKVRGRVTDQATLADLRTGKLDGLSIGYVAIKAHQDAKGHRVLDQVNLQEISLVKRPASSRARVLSVKSYPQNRKAKTMADLTNTPPDDKSAEGENPLDSRVGNLETTVADHGTRLKTIEDNTAKAVKSLSAVETILRRPGAHAAATNDQPDLETKAFNAFLRQGREGMDVTEVKSLRVADDTGAGYLAPAEFVKEIVKNIVLVSPVRQVAKVMSTSAQQVTLPKRTGTPTASWVGETQTRTATQSTYGGLEFQVRELTAFTDISNQMLEDAAFDVGAEITSDLSEQFGKSEGAAFVNGTGVNQPMGFLVDPTVNYIATGDATKITADNLIDLFHQLPTVYAANAVWAMNRQVLGYVRKLKDSQGRYLVDIGGVGAKPGATLLGSPVLELPDMPGVVANATPIVFGDFKNGYRIFDRLAVAILRDPYTQQANGQVRFHARRRVAGGVAKGEALLKLKVSAN